jgi:poly(hydroxyalkanoate) depolymerase family esterase
MQQSLLRRKRNFMSPFEKAVTQLQTLRRKFEGLLETARQKVAQERPASAPGPSALREVPEFGGNPGNLRMFVHVPERLPSMAPLVVALHGCNQTANDYDCGSGWSALADRLGFAVVYAEQQPANNPQNCFSWFLPDDTLRDLGEVRSIQQMVEHALATFGLDPRRVFVTGLSAGGAMASAMLATYPEVFAGGAIIAGLPYGSARNAQQAFDVMFTEHTYSAAALGNRVRAASGHRGPWPKISIWHGTADPIVKPSNSEHIVRQWANVHGIPATPSIETSIGGHTRRVWNDASGEALIEAFSIAGMAHGVPLASTPGANSCGVPGAFFLDAGISSTHHIAGFWHLGEGLTATSHAPATVPEADPVQTDGRAVSIAAEPGASSADEASYAANAEPASRRPLDPMQVIGAAFKAAGFPVPELPNTSFPNAPAGATPRVGPLPIIQAALKAAGLTRT